MRSKWSCQAVGSRRADRSLERGLDLRQQLGILSRRSRIPALNLLDELLLGCQLDPNSVLRRAEVKVLRQDVFLRR